MRECREIATLVREPLRACVVGRGPGKESTDSLAMEVVVEGKAYTLTNVYNPPKKDLTLDCAPGVISRTIIWGFFQREITRLGLHCPQQRWTSGREAFYGIHPCTATRHGYPTHTAALQQWRGVEARPHTREP